MATSIPNPSGGGTSPVSGTTPPSDQPADGPVPTEVQASPAPRPKSGIEPAPSKPTSAPGTSKLPSGSRITSAPGIGPSGTVDKTLEPGAKAGTVVEDIATDKALKNLTRVAYQGKDYPALAGIPLLRKLGQGGMGAVYYGIHPRLGNEVAVKILPVHLVETNPTLVNRFLREARIAAQIKSPHLPVVSDVNEEAGLYYLVMEFVNGLTGAKYLSNVKKTGAIGLVESEACIIIGAACEGLQVAHSAQIVHRDIKPDNIMLPYRNKKTKELDFAMAKVMDLGLAKHSHDSGSEESADALTATQMAMGTPGFMAPEQVMDARKAGVRSDVFSMGATLYALLGGQSPFHRSTSIQTLMATMECSYEPLGKARPDASPFIVSIVERCLLKSPEERFANAGELGLAIKQGQVQETSPMDGMTVVSARPSTTVRQAAAAAASAAVVTEAVPAPAKPKKKALVLVGAVLGAALLIGGVGAWVHYDSLKKEETARLQDVWQKFDNKLKDSLEADDETSFGEAKALLEKESNPKYLKEARAARQEMAGVYQSLIGFKLDEAKKMADGIAAQYPNEAGISDLLREARKRINSWPDFIPDVDDIIKEVKAELKDASAGKAGALLSAERKIKRAKKDIPKYPPLVAVAQECAKIRKDVADKEAKEKQLKEFENTLAEVTPLLEKGTYLEKGTNIGEMEGRLTRFKDVFPDEPAFKQALALLEKRKKFERELKLATRYLDPNDLNDVAEAEGKLKVAGELFPEDPRLKVALDSIADKRRIDEENKKKIALGEEEKKKKIAQNLAQANTLIDSGRPADLDQARERLRLVETEDPNNAEAKQARVRLQGKQSEAERLADEKKEKLDVLKGLDEILKTEILKTENLDEILKQVEGAERKYGANDPEVVSRRLAYNNKKKDYDEKAKRKRADTILADVDKKLNDENADSFDIENAIAEAKKLSSDDPRIGSYSLRLQGRREAATKKYEVQESRKSYDTLLTSVDDILAKDGNLDDALVSLDKAQKLVPDDPKLKTLFGDDSKLRTLRATVSDKRQKKVVTAISEKLAKYDLRAAKTLIEEADPGTYLDKVNAELAQKEGERNTEFNKVKTAFENAGTGLQLADAEKLLEGFKTKFINDKEIKVLDTSHDKAVEKVRGAVAIQERSKVQDALSSWRLGADFSGIQAQFDDYDKTHQADPELPALKQLLNSKKADNATFGNLKLAVEALTPSTALTQTQQTQFEQLGQNQNYAKSPGFIALKESLKAKEDDRQALVALVAAEKNLPLADGLTNTQTGQLEKLKKDYANDAALKALVEQMAKRETDKGTFGDLKQVVAAAGFAGKLTDAQNQQLKGLKERYPKDAQITALETSLNAKSAAAAAARKQAERDAALAKVKQAIPGPLDEAQRQFDVFKDSYPGDPALPELLGKLQTRTAADANKVTVARIRALIAKEDRRGAQAELNKATGLDAGTKATLQSDINKIPGQGEYDRDDKTHTKPPARQDDEIKRDDR